jgi:thioredoxin reductase (NADPH)
MAEHNLQSIAFPILGAEQIGQLASCADVAAKEFRDGETLIAGGSRCPKFFIVLSGQIEIFDVSGDEPKTITIHGEGEFTGDIAHLTGTPAIYSAVTARFSKSQARRCATC